MSKIKVFLPQISNLDQFKRNRNTDPAQVLGKTETLAEYENQGTYDFDVECGGDAQVEEGDHDRQGTVATPGPDELEAMDDPPTNPHRTAVEGLETRERDPQSLEGEDGENKPSGKETEGKKDRNPCPAIADDSIAVVIARRGSTKNRIYKVVFKEVGKEDMWVLPHQVPNHLLEEFFLKEQQLLNEKAELKKREKQINKKIAENLDHKYNTRSKRQTEGD